MICWHCKQEVSDAEEYCPYCGRKLSEDPDGKESQIQKSTIPNRHDQSRTAKQNTLRGQNVDRKKRIYRSTKKNTNNNSSQRTSSPKKILPVLAGVAAALLIGFLLFKDDIYKLDKQGMLHTHKWVSATCTNPKTCSLCGLTEGRALGHKWKKATCTDPKTCSVCGLTEGKALGHQWEDATCTLPRTCSRCKATEGNALGHDWRHATYDSPKTCRRCKTTQGHVRGYVSPDELSRGEFSDEISFHDYRTHAYEFENELKKCRKIRLGISISDTSGDPFGEYGVWVRSDGDWELIGSLYVEEEDEVYKDTFAIDPALTIDAIISLPIDTPNHEVSWSSTLYFEEAQIE